MEWAHHRHQHQSSARRRWRARGGGGSGIWKRAGAAVTREAEEKSFIFEIPSNNFNASSTRCRVSAAMRSRSRATWPQEKSRSCTELGGKPRVSQLVVSCRRAFMSDEFDGLDATEKTGIRAALIRCRVLAAKIANDLRNKRPEHFVDKLSLADIHTSLERAAWVLEQKTAKG